MANTFVNKKSGKTLDTRAFNINNFRALITASGTTIGNDGVVGGVVDGERLEFHSTIDKIPFRYQKGDQAKFFPRLQNGTGTAGIILTGSDGTGSIIRNTTSNITYFAITLEDLKFNYVGEGSHISKSLAEKHGVSQAYFQISSSFINLFSGTSDDVTVTFAGEDSYTPLERFTASFADSITSPFTASATFKCKNTPFTHALPEPLTSSFSGIDTDGNGVELVLDLSDSVSATHTSIRSSVGGVIHDVIHNVFFATSSLVFKNSGSVTQSFTSGLEHNSFNTEIRQGGGTASLQIAVPASSGSNLTSSLTFNDPQEGTATLDFPFPSTMNTQGVLTGSTGTIPFADPIRVVNINSHSAADGTYSSFNLKGKIAGDSDSGSLYSFFDFAPSQNEVEIVIYPFGTTVASASFRFIPHDIVDAGISSSSDVTASEDLRTLFYVSSSTTPGFEGLFTSSLSPLRLGSLLHADAALKTTASYGFYSLSGSNTHTFEVQTASIDNSGLSLGIQTMKVPRIVRTFTN